MDLITYVPSLKEMFLEAKRIQNNEDNPLSKYLIIEGDTLIFNVCKIPVKYLGDESTLCLVRGIPSSVIKLSSSIKVIGECINGDYVFYDGGQDVYESIYNTQSRIIEDGEGGSIEYKPPYKIGVFT